MTGCVLIWTCTLRTWRGSKAAKSQYLPCVCLCEQGELSGEGKEKIKQVCVKQIDQEVHSTVPEVQYSNTFSKFATLIYILWIIFRHAGIEHGSTWQVKSGCSSLDAQTN